MKTKTDISILDIKEVLLKLQILLCHLKHYVNKSSLYKLATENELNYELKGDCKLSSA